MQADISIHTQDKIFFTAIPQETHESEYQAMKKVQKGFRLHKFIQTEHCVSVRMAGSGATAQWGVDLSSFLGDAYHAFR